MKVLLLDIDSKIPNLALMKLSAWHKQQGNEVIFNFPLASSFCDKIYASVIFPENRLKAKMMDITGRAIIGGSGSGNWDCLPDEIDKIKPDYDLYDMDYSLGFTTRGCIRNCSFCIVPKKEGKIKAVADIYNIWDKKHNKVVLLDNNILALKDHFFKIAAQLKYEKLTVDFNQGLDFRLLDIDVCKELKRLKHSTEYRFAFDNPNDSDKILKAIELLKSTGINRANWYVLVGFNTTFEQDLFRFELLKKQGQRAYCMRYKSVKKETKYIRLAEWVNQRHLFAKMGYYDYLQFRGCRKVA